MALPLVIMPLRKFLYHGLCVLYYMSFSLMNCSTNGYQTTDINIGWVFMQVLGIKVHTVLYVEEACPAVYHLHGG